MTIIVGRMAFEKENIPPVSVTDDMRPVLDSLYNPRHVPVIVEKNWWGYRRGVLFQSFSTGRVRYTYYDSIGRVTERWL